MCKITTIPLGLEIDQMLEAEQHRGRLRAELIARGHRRIASGGRAPVSRSAGHALAK